MPRKGRGMHFHQVILQVKDVDRSREFYTEKLGFQVLHDYSPRYLAIQTPNKMQIGFHPFEPGDTPARSKRRSAGMEFEVDNVDAWYQKLRKLGVKFVEKPKDSWGEREARFLDPDNYRLAISCPSKKSRR